MQIKYCIMNIFFSYHEVYAFTLIIAVLLSVLACKYGKKDENGKSIELNSFFLLLLVIFLIIVSGLRVTDSYAIDEMNYRTRALEYIGQPFLSALNNASKSNMELGWFVLNWLLANLIKTDQSIIFVSAAISNILIILTLKNYARPFPISIFLYVSVIYFTSFNIIRQYLAASILFMALKYITRKNFWKYLIFIIIAMTIHRTAIIMLPLYFLSTIKLKAKYQIILIVVVMLIMANFEKIFSTIVPFLSIKSEESYLKTFQDIGGVNPFRIIFWSIPGLWVMINRNEYEKNLNVEKVFINYSFINTLTWLLSSVYIYIARFAIYFCIYCCVVFALIPQFFKKKERWIIYLLIIISGLALGWNEGISWRYSNVLLM